MIEFMKDLYDMRDFYKTEFTKWLINQSYDNTLILDGIEKTLQEIYPEFSEVIREWRYEAVDQYYKSQQENKPHKRNRTEYQRQYYLKRREELLERHKQWAKDHPEAHVESSKRWREKKKQAEAIQHVTDSLELPEQEK